MRGRSVGYLGEWEGAPTQLCICHSILPLHSTLCIGVVHLLGTNIVGFIFLLEFTYDCHRATHSFTSLQPPPPPDTSLWSLVFLFNADTNYDRIECYLLSKYSADHGNRTVLNHSLTTPAGVILPSNHHRQPCGHLTRAQSADFPLSGTARQAQLDRVDVA